eukprot:SAG11_NODE_1029_length_6121_cov_24.347891_3_plen_136_part_00
MRISYGLSGPPPSPRRHRRRPPPALRAGPARAGLDDRVGAAGSQTTATTSSTTSGAMIGSSLIRHGAVRCCAPGMPAVKSSAASDHWESNAEATVLCHRLQVGPCDQVEAVRLFDAAAQYGSLNFPIQEQKRVRH